MARRAAPLALGRTGTPGFGGYGLARMPAAPTTASADKPLRLGLVQSNIVDYETLRKEKGARTPPCGKFWTRTTP